MVQRSHLWILETRHPWDPGMESWDEILPSLGSHARFSPPLMSQTGVPSPLGSPASWHKLCSANNSPQPLPPFQTHLSGEQERADRDLSLPGAGGSVRADATFVSPPDFCPLRSPLIISSALTAALNHRPCSRWD